MTTPLGNGMSALLADPFYLGSDGVESRVMWTAAPDGQTEYLAVKPETADAAAANTEHSPAVLSIVGQLRVDRFYLSMDGIYNPDHQMAWQVNHTPVENLLNGTASCLFGPPPVSFPEARAPWQGSIDSVGNIISNSLPMVAKSGFYTHEEGRVVLKFVHKPFEARDPASVLEKPPPRVVAQGSSTDACGPKDAAGAGEASNGAGQCQKYDATHLQALEALDGDREPEFRTINVPAHPRNREAILDLAHTHVFNPLCAFMSENRASPIIPAQYGTVLPGAIVRISFTLSHRLMRRPANVSHFTATINEIEVLHRPAIVSMTPGKALKNKMFLKRGRIGEPIVDLSPKKRARANAW